MMQRALLVAALLAAPSLQAAMPTLPKRYTNSTGNSGRLRPLKFNADGTFQISIFQDLHFGENAWDQWGHINDMNGVGVINAVLNNESPDLVVLNGDLITGENQYLFNGSHYVDLIVGPLLERNLTWASTYGNHDNQYNLSSASILEREHLWPNNARTKQMVFGEKAGVSNYYLPVYANNRTNCNAPPELLLWFFDSRGGGLFQTLDANGNQMPREDWVDISVVNWFVENNNRITKKFNKTIPSLAFVHIPTAASLSLQTKSGVDSHKQPGINADYPLAQQGQGWCADGTHNCDYGNNDVPFMQALVNTPGMMAVFSGHDHGDTWCYKWDKLLPGMTVAGNGINLCFGQHSGYGGYGNWIRGARQVVVTQEKLKELAVDTYNRLESGAIVGSVTLNSTFGQDSYPEVPNDMTYCKTCDWNDVTPMPGTK